MESPTRPTGRSPKRSDIRSRAHRASGSGESWSPFHPRTAYRSVATVIRPPPARNTLRPKGNMRKSEMSNGRTRAKLCGSPPCRSSTTASAFASWPVKLRRGAWGIDANLEHHPCDLAERRLNLAEVKVLKRATCCRSPLTLVSRAVLRAAVGVLGRAGQSEEAELTDLHTGPELDRQGGDVRQFERDVTAEPRVDETGRGVRK